MNTTTQTRCHLHTCQAPDVAYCTNQATDLVIVEDSTLEMCVWCAERGVREYGAEFLAPIPSDKDAGWIA